MQEICADETSRGLSVLKLSSDGTFKQMTTFLKKARLYLDGVGKLIRLNMVYTKNIIA